MLQTQITLNTQSRLRSFLFPTVAVLFICLVFLLMMSRNMQEPLHHDEHMYVSSGELLAEHAMLPYKDYPYFQMPDLVVVYAAIFKVLNTVVGTDYNLLWARIFSTVCAALSMGIVFFVASVKLREHGLLVRFLLAAGSVVLFFTNPLFTQVSGLAWNHDLSILFALLAFVLHAHGIRREKAERWLVLSGVMLGSAIGTRLSLGLAVAPFLGLILLYPNRTFDRRKAMLLLAFCLGLFLGMLPSLILFALAPAQFEFGNFAYHQLNTAFKGEAGATAISLDSKLRLFLKVMIEPGNVVLLLLFAFFVMWKGFKRMRAKPSNYPQVLFILALLPFLLLGSFGPTPSAPRYFYQLVPFLILGVVYAIAHFQEWEKAKSVKRGLQLFGLAALATAVFSVSNYQNIGNLLSPEKWAPVQVSRVGTEIISKVGNGKVLTLAPIYPLEGDGRIYNEFATAPFGWRMGHLLSDNKRKVLGIVTADDLSGYLRNDPPKAILVGEPFEADLEKPLVDYAQKNGFQASTLPNGETLWLARSAAQH